MNKVILIGRVGAEPVVTDTVAKFSLATDYKKTDGEKVTEWHNIKIFGKLRETVEKWVRKGNRICVEGRVQTQKYEDKFFTDIVVERLEIIDFPKDEEAVSTEAAAPTDNPFSDIPF